MLIESNESKDIEKRIKKEIKTISSTLDLLKEKLNQIERIGEEEKRLCNSWVVIILHNLLSL